MSNLRIAAKNLIDSGCTLSCSVAVTLPLNNLKNQVHGRIARIPASPAFDIKGTHTAAIYASMCGITWTNLSSAATWRFQGYSDAAWSSQVVDSTTLPALASSSIFNPFYGQKQCEMSFTRTQIQSSKITITDTANSDGHIDASRLWVADDFELAHNPVYGMKIGWKEETSIWTTDGGSPRSDAGVPYRQLTFDLDSIPEADRLIWMDILRYCGMRNDVFVRVYPTGTAEQKRDYTINGLISSMPDLTTVGLGRDSTNITIREL
jgi:hypothetical protein